MELQTLFKRESVADQSLRPMQNILLSEIIMAHALFRDVGTQNWRAGEPVPANLSVQEWRSDISLKNRAESCRVVVALRNHTLSNARPAVDHSDPDGVATQNLSFKI